MAKSHPFDAFIEHAAQIFASALVANLPAAGRAGKAGASSAKASSAKASSAKAGKRARSSWLKGKKLDMSCRVAGCKNKSGGPRHGYMCETHQKLPKNEQQAARDAWKAKQAKA
jgi:hypothetical protein